MVRQHHHRTAHHKVFAKLAALEIRVIDEYRRSADIACRRTEALMRKAFTNKQRKVERGERDAEELDVIAEQRDMALRIHGLAEELAIIALFRVVELSYGRVVRFVAGGPEIPRWVGQKDEREQRILEVYGFNMQDTQEYRSVEDLRTLNNTIKHRRGVGIALSVDPPEREEEERTRCTRTYEHVAPLVPGHIEDFAGRMLRARP